MLLDTGMDSRVCRYNPDTRHQEVHNTRAVVVCRMRVACCLKRPAEQKAREPREPNMDYTRPAAPCPPIAEDLRAVSRSLTRIIRTMQIRYTDQIITNAPSLVEHLHWIYL